MSELSRRFPEAEITFVDASPDRGPPGPVCLSGKSGMVTRTPVTYPTKRNGALRRIAAEAHQEYFRMMFRLLGIADVRAISVVAPALRDAMGRAGCDLVIGHNIDTLPLVCEIGRSRGAVVVFDCMEIYSDMGEGQSDLDRRLVETLERTYLPRCDLVTASSREVAAELERRYRLRAVLPVYNAAPSTPAPPPAPDDGRFHLYWRNATIGLGQRGLADAIDALALLPDDVVLNVQGRPGSRIAAIRDRAAAAGVGDRLVVHPPFALGRAVAAASRFSVGLCPERDTCLNQRLTVSNKVFDYLMAGLAVIASDLPGLAGVVTESGAGLTHPPGDPAALAACVRRLYDDRDLLARLRTRALEHAGTRANEEMELARFGEAVTRAIARATPGGTHAEGTTERSTGLVA